MLVTFAPLLLLFAIPLLLLRAALRPVSDPDTFWHIRAGEYLASTGRFSGPEPWSAFSSNLWALHEWLPQLGYFATWRAAGLPGVAALNAVTISAFFVLLYGLCRHVSGLLPALLAASVAWIGASGSLSPRPQMVTFALIGVWTTAWLLTANDHKPRWWLIPLTWVWACSHGMWFVGVVISGCALVGMALERSIDWRQIGRLALIPLLSLGAAACTPLGPALFLAPLHVGDYTKYVSEWAPPSIREYNVAVTLLMAVICAVLWARSSRRVPWPQLALLVTALGWTLLYARTVAVGAVMLAPLLAITLAAYVPKRLINRKLEVTGLAASLTGAVLLALAMAPAVAQHPGRVPDSFSGRVSALPSGAVVYNDYELGGWLLLSHRHVRTVIDPRTEVFSVDYVDEYMASLRAAPGWRTTVASSGASVAILPTTSPLAGELVHAGWQDVQQEKGYSYLTRPSTPG
jgi:hypothetical protein